MNINKYSELSSSISIVNDNGIMCVNKRTSLSSRIRPYSKIIAELTMEYYLEFCRAGMPVPEIFYINSHDGAIESKFTFMGDNLVEYYKEAATPFDSESICSGIKLILSNAHSAGICLDPHPKNFVTYGGAVYYIDFLPPLTTKYEEILIANSSEHDCPLLLDFLRIMRPENLAAHFMADVRKTWRESSSGSWFNRLYSKICEESQMLSSKQLESSMDQIEKIEITRKERAIPLI